MPMRKLLAAGICLCLPFGVMADVRHDLDRPELAATVNGEPLGNAFIDVMFRVASKGDSSITRAGVVQALIDDRLIAAHARATDPDEHLIEDNKVGFSPAMQIEQAMISNLQAAFRTQLEARLKREKGGTLNGLIVAERAPTDAEWTNVVGGNTGLQLEYALNEQQRAAATKVALLKYRFAGAPGQVTLLEVYDAQNVQGRNQLHGRNGAFAAEQARQLLKHRYILAWARSAEGLGEADFAVFRRAMEDRLIHTGWMAHLGVAADIHDDPQHLKDLQAAVTREEISAFYQAHRDEFRRIEKVKARHIRVADEKRAGEIAERLKKGEGFADLARRFSIAADAATGGDLGWIVHGEKGNDWLDSFAFLQKPGVASRPVRMPGGEGGVPAWEILLVEERVMGWQPEDSESVRYLASQAIAKQKAVQGYRSTLEKLRRDADIRLSPALSPLARPQGGKGA
jgi:parvulin-like peptidyl-prolyl isomerase